MEKRTRIPGFDTYQLYNHMIFEGISSEKKTVNAEEFYTSDMYRTFSESIIGKLLYEDVTLRVMGIFRNGTDDEVLIEATASNGLKGVINLRGETVIPIRCTAIQKVPIEKGTVFITDSIKDGKLTHSLYANDCCIVEGATEIIPGFTQGFDYQLDNKDSFVRDISFSLDKSNSLCNEILVRKELPVNKELRNFVENATFEDCELTIYDDEGKYSLYDNLKYEAFLASKENQMPDALEISIVLKTELFKGGNADLIEQYYNENKLIKGYFSNDAFVK